MPVPGGSRKSSKYRKARAERLAVARMQEEPCYRCHLPVDYSLSGNHPMGPTLDHMIAVKHTGTEDFTEETAAISHRVCNLRAGTRPGPLNIVTNRGKNRANIVANPELVTNPSERGSSDRPTSAPPPFRQREAPKVVGSGVDLPRLHPDGFPYPRVETPERPGTDHALADQVLEWIDREGPGPKLLPWQRYVVWRGFETADGRLWRNVAFLVSRQMGKTYVMQRIMLARLNLAHLFGSTAILNTHPDFSQAIDLVEVLARDLHTGYLRARSNGADWWLDAKNVQQVGQGRVWKARAQTRAAITGQAGIGMVFVDELQAARQPVIDRTVRPILSGSRTVNPQAWFAGTGERDDSDVLRAMRGAGARGDDTLWLEWSAPPGCGSGDENAWRWASPDWTPQRRDTLAADLLHMQEIDFRSEYLVQHDAQVTVWIARQLVEACGSTDPIHLQPSVGALEVASDQVSWSAAASDGQSVTTIMARPLAEAVDWLAARQVPIVLAHQSVLNRPELQRLGAELVAVKVHEAAGATAELGDAVRSGQVTWDNSRQVADAMSRVVVAQVDGLRRIIESRSRGDVSIIKAMSWALWYARQNAPELAAIW